MNRLSRHLLFDLDGTLVDSVGGIEFSAAEAVRVVCPERTGLSLRPFIGPPVRIMFARALEMSPTDPLPLSLEVAFRRIYDEHGWKRVTAYPGIPELLREWSSSGVTCHVVTNKPHRPARLILDHLGLLPWLDQILSPDSHGPTPVSKSENIRRILEQSSVPPAQFLMVGDSPDDAEAAASNRVPFIHAAYGYASWPEQVPPRLAFVSQPEELGALVEKWLLT